MARKLKSQAAATPPDAAESTDNPLEDLFVMAPDLPIEVGGRKLTVQEYRFFTQEQRARVLGKALIADLQKMVGDGEAKDAGIERYLDLLAEHQPAVQALMSMSIEGADAEFINSLNPDDGEQLQLAWWSVTGRFFWRTVVKRLRDRTLTNIRRKALGGSTSSSPSAAPTEPSISATSTVASPAVN